MHRIFLPDRPVSGRISITGEKAVYISIVLRLVPGDMLIIHDGEGTVCRSRILNSTKREVVAVVEEQLPPIPESPVHIRLFQGLLKGEKMDLVIQKTVELGVSEIVPVVTERSQVRQTRKLERWRKIAEEAARQSGRAVIPSVHEVVDLGGFMRCRGSHERLGITFWEERGEGLRNMLKGMQGVMNVDLFTGPEGGLSRAEVESASEAGFLTATLGRRILRAETAAMAAVSVIQYELGDLGGG